MRTTPSSKIVNPTVDNMTAGFASAAVNLDHYFGYSVQAQWSGTAPTGTFKLQASDVVSPGTGLASTDWSDLSASIQAVSGNTGSILINTPNVFYRWIRAVRRIRVMRIPQKQILVPVAAAAAVALSVLRVVAAVPVDLWMDGLLLRPRVMHGRWVLAVLGVLLQLIQVPAEMVRMA